MGKALKIHSGPACDELEAALEAQVAGIFERLSELYAFSVAERLVLEDREEGVREWELYVSAIAAYPELGSDQSALFVGEISNALAELCNERPQAADILCGRTFARSWH